jgi:general secretion pathway protein F
MPVFEYSALDLKGKTVSGIIDADSAFSARQKLRASKIFPVTVQEVRDTTSKSSSQQRFWQNPFARVKPAEISMITRQLATLVGAGFPLVPALDTLIPQIRSQIFQKMVARIKDAILEGSSFAAALSHYPSTFPSFYTNMIRAGESSGSLEIVLDRLADITEKQQALKNRIKSAMTYPILMGIIGIVVLAFLLTVIVPSITSIFSDMNQILPTPTRWLIWISELFQAYWWLLLIFFIVLIISYQMIKRTPKGRSIIDKTILYLPLFGQLAKKVAIARFARTLGSLLENGVSMLPALEIVQNIVGNTTIANLIETTAVDVGKGKGLGVALQSGKIFPSLPIQMIIVGEQTGELENMLTKVADVYENEVETTLMSLTSLLEPLMILLMGLAVGFIVLAICLPIFEMNQLII